MMTIANLEHRLRRLELHRRKRQSPGLSQDPEHIELQKSCRWDVKRFAQEFFPHYCSRPFSLMHEDFFEQYQEDKGRRGLRDATAAPRGNAKTTVRAVIKTIHDCVYQHEKYILVISSRAEMARDKVKDIRDELESNARIAKVFGRQVGPLWNQHDFITSRGVRVRAASPKSQIRGLLWRGTRPTKVLLDDAENSELVETETNREKFKRWFESDIAKLGNQNTNFDIIGTILHPQSLLANLLQNPGYRHHYYQAVLQFADSPESMALWQQWREIIVDLTNDHRLADARAFFEANQKAMLADSVVLWPEGESYYDLALQRIIEGDDAFYREKQNMPLGSSRYPFNMELAGYFRLEPDRLVRHDRRVVNLFQIPELSAYWDPALGEERGTPDWSCCVIVGRDHYGYYYVLDCYLAQYDQPEEQVRAIADLLWRWNVPKCGIEANGFQSLLISDLREAMAQKCLDEQTLDWSCMLLPITNTKSKVLRINALQPMVANRWLWFADQLPVEAIRQMREFRPVRDAGKDDFPDAVEGAIRVSKGIIDKRGAA